MIGGNISELKIVVSLATDKMKQGITSVKSQMASLKRSVQTTSSSITPSINMTASSVGNITTETKKASLAMRAFGQGGASVASTLTLALGKISPQFGEMREKITSVGSSMKGLGGVSKAAMLAVGASIVAIVAVAVVKIFSAIYKKVGEMVSFAAPAEYEKAMKPLNESVDKLKTSIGTALTPAFAIISNGIRVVADALTVFIENVVAPYYGFIAGIFGWMSAFDTSGVTDVSDSMASASDSTGKMADDVKEMGKGLAGFDKLTTQSKSSDSTTDSEAEAERQRSVEQYEKIKESMEKGAKFAEDVKNFLAPVGNFFENIRQQIEKIITKVTKGIVKIWAQLTKHWKKITSAVGPYIQQIANFIGSVVGTIGNGLSQAWSWITTTVGNAWDKVTSIFNEVSTTLGNVWGNLLSGFTGAFETIRSNIMGFLTTIRSLIDNALNTVGNAFGALFSGDFSGVWDSFMDGFNEMKRIVGNWFDKTFNIDWDGIFRGMQDGFKGAVNAIVDVWNSVIPDLKLGIEIPILNKWVGISTDFLKLPHLAKGGLIEPNNPMPVIVGDNTKEKEAIAPISTLEGMIDRSVRNAMSKYDNQQSRQDITLNIDGRKLARITHNYNTMESRRRGATIARSV